MFKIFFNIILKEKKTNKTNENMMINKKRVGKIYQEII